MIKPSEANGSAMQNRISAGKAGIFHEAIRQIFRLLREKELILMILGVMFFLLLGIMGIHKEAKSSLEVGQIGSPIRFLLSILFGETCGLLIAAILGTRSRSNQKTHFGPEMRIFRRAQVIAFSVILVTFNLALGVYASGIYLTYGPWNLSPMFDSWHTVTFLFIAWYAIFVFQILIALLHYHFRHSVYAVPACLVLLYFYGPVSLHFILSETIIKYIAVISTVTIAFFVQVERDITLPLDMAIPKSIRALCCKYKGQD